MTIRMRQVLTIGALVAILAIGAGVAAADSIGNDQDAFLNNVAKRLSVTPAELKAALKGANDDRIDAAVAAGKITKEQGEAMKARSAEGGVPFFRRRASRRRLRPSRRPGLARRRPRSTSA